MRADQRWSPAQPVPYGVPPFQNAPPSAPAIGGGHRSEYPRCAGLLRYLPPHSSAWLQRLRQRCGAVCRSSGAWSGQFRYCHGLRTARMKSHYDHLSYLELHSVLCRRRVDMRLLRWPRLSFLFLAIEPCARSLFLTRLTVIKRCCQTLDIRPHHAQRESRRGGPILSS